MRISGQRRGEAYPEARHASGSTIQSASVTVTFTEENGLIRFNAVAVPGLPADAQPWTSLDGETSPSGETAGACGCWNLGDGTVDLLAIYNGALSSVNVPIRVFWVV
jgi:hypothetical protein